MPEYYYKIADLHNLPQHFLSSISKVDSSGPYVDARECVVKDQLCFSQLVSKSSLNLFQTESHVSLLPK